MASRRPTYIGCAVSLTLVIFLGFPLWAILLLGERACDMHIGPPCAIGWGWMKLLNGVVIVVFCGAVGWLTGFLARAAGKPPE
jgi:hypothetical protein